MNKISIFQKPWLLSVGLMVPTLMTLASMPANALDLNGYSRSDDAACAVDPDCAMERGGVSDVMTIFSPDGSIFDRIFAFGNEEANNGYYFDPAKVAVNSELLDKYTTLLEPNGSWSDAFGVRPLPGVPVAVRVDGNFPLDAPFVLGFFSDPQTDIPPTGSIVYYEKPGDNPYKYILEPGSVLTIPYDATFYLSKDLQVAGYKAQFQSDYEVPEPLTMLGAGAAFGFGSFFKRKLGKNNKQDKA